MRAKMYKIYPSQIAPASGEVPVEGWSSTCIRQQEFTERLKLPKTDIDEYYKMIGMLGEHYVHSQLLKQFKHYKTLPEVPIKYQINDEWQISGRVDFLMQHVYEDDQDFFIEVKTSSNARKSREIIKGGKVDPIHIGQIVIYSLMTKMTKAKYVFNFITTDAISRLGTKLNVGVDQRVFDIEIDGNKIIIDGAEWEKYTVSDYMKYIKLKMQSKAKVPARIADTFKCKWCVFYNLCDKVLTYDDLESLYENIGLHEIPSKGPVVW
jgi:hypothetical protein